jgi:F0F1-type ATP synthase assembly protein I
MTSEPDKIDDLQRRIAELKGDTQPAPPESKAEESAEDKQGLGAAYELIMTPIVCGGIGLGVDKIFSTAPVFFISLAILGVCAGFWRIYRLSNNIQTPLDLKRLQDTEKKGRKAQISENKTEES